ncbi:MAG: response regulator [Agriterribacter sp.]
MFYILIKDDYIIYRKGLSALIKENFPSSTIIEVEATSSLLAKTSELPAGLIIIDIREVDEKDIDVLKQIRKQLPHTGIIVMTFSSSSLFATEMVEAGATVCLNKNCSVPDFTAALKKIVSQNTGINLC